MASCFSKTSVMTFLADLHVHSKYSRATSRDLDLERLAFWAALKGLAVVATGDCVHPAWLAELKDKLIPDGGGLFRLKPEIEASCLSSLPPVCRADVRFMLSTEISTIYKKGERTRKVHHLIYVPSFDAAERLAAQLARVGNIASDGRPILGLDSRDLLDIALSADPQAYLVPAHIWTPWFSALGSQSGFESIAECYGDLAEHIFAVETGLSSDPAMNWRVSSLDRYRLVSNSDAHSPPKLGREATRFSCAPDYSAMEQALRTGEGYVGTVEFFPEEGKYHWDGHRACEVCLNPKETIARNGRCPVCGRPVTVGVAHRVEALADRAEEAVVPPPTAGAVDRLVPLPEILSELLGCGSAAKSVKQAYDRVTATLGPELAVLRDVPIDDVACVHPLLGEAVTRLRAGSVLCRAGYDGAYGVIRLFAEDELDLRQRGGLLFDAPIRRKPRAVLEPCANEEEPAGDDGHDGRVSLRSTKRKGILAALDDDQARAAALGEGPVLVMAGPGSGKTRLLTHRVAHLVQECGVEASSCLVLTFTRRATEELRARFKVLLKKKAKHCAIHSFHSFCLMLLRDHASVLGLPPDFTIADEAKRKAVLVGDLHMTARQAAQTIKEISFLKRTGAEGSKEARQACEALARRGREEGWVDFDDLMTRAVELLEKHDDIRALWRRRFLHISADEFQDVDEVQYRLLKLLAGPEGNLFVIGDPNQAIYGFRGGDATCFERLTSDFPGVQTVRLDRNYRSSGTIVEASSALVGLQAPDAALRPKGESLKLYIAATENLEASFVASSIEQVMGGHDMLVAQRGRAKQGKASTSLSFADVAVLYRTDAQAGALREALDRAGIPYKKSTPLPLADHTGVAALMDVLARQEEKGALSAKIDTAHESAGKREDADASALAEAKAWLKVLGAAPGVDENLDRLREQVALATEADFRDERADRVSLLTMHAAKGLEFPVVFIVGMEHGLMPLVFAEGGAHANGEDEERRLFYVAMTRAKDLLYLTRAVTRFYRGESRTLPPSPFLTDLPQDLVEQLATAKRKPRQRQYRLF
ncbi:MAG: UvrD-helicase domain-containing protein [Alphaproteobacteria bacterium]|nr:UvrD-helicase domain-containing protein [Alphaproteobacteria bacterium]